ncbi:uncharacterized protein LOC118022509 [Mirounga leonina]|uniref:uncharacterized protein LOC118022509 n=1 Tax=Mirounga leonina TaxID=9715 RepID=UPI00156C3EF8|nr:uncharacterized protein LOC118022509 [Mirounga leonina]
MTKALSIGLEWGRVGLGRSGSVGGTTWGEAAQPQQESGRKASAFDIATSPSSSSLNVCLLLCSPGITHLNSSSTPSEASVLAGSTRIQGHGHRSTTPVWTEVRKLLAAHALSQLSSAGSGSRAGNLQEGRLQTSAESSQEVEAPRRFASRSPRNVIFREGTKGGEAESALRWARGEGAGEGEQYAKLRRASSGPPAPRSLSSAFRREAAGADHVREPEPGRGGRAAWRGWAIPPSFQTLYKQTPLRARGEGEDAAGRGFAAAGLRRASLSRPGLLGATSDRHRYPLPHSSHPKGARPETPEKKSPALAGLPRFLHGAGGSVASPDAAAAAGDGGGPRLGPSRREGLPGSRRSGQFLLEEVPTRRMGEMFTDG